MRVSLLTVAGISCLVWTQHSDSGSVRAGGRPNGVGAPLLGRSCWRCLITASNLTCNVGCGGIRLCQLHAVC